MTGMAVNLGLVPSEPALREVCDLDAFKEHAEFLNNSDLGFSAEFSNVKRSVLDHPDYRIRYTPGIPEVRARNRYSDIGVLDDTRVRLRSSSQDYINASMIRSICPSGYIAAQAPLETTIEDFWTMCWENASPVVIQLTPWVEGRGRSMRRKADRYFPDQPSSSERYGDFVVECLDMCEQDKKAGLVVRRLALSNARENQAIKTLFHMHFVMWPDFSNVTDVSVYINIHAVMDKYLAIAHDEATTANANAADASSSDNKLVSSRPLVGGPPVVHCSAGIGRTGTFIAVNELFHHLRKAVREGAKNASNDHKMVIDVAKVVADLRNQRPGMVIVPEQYAMVYRVIYYCLFGTHLEANNDSGSSGVQQGTMKDSNIYKKLIGGG